MTGLEDAIDPAMLELFRAELDSHLPELSKGLLALEKDTYQPKWFESMMRAAHSIKGAARIVGVEDAVRVAHALEDCFVEAQKQDIRLAPSAIDVLLRGVDVLGSFSNANTPPLTVEALNEVVGTISALHPSKNAKLVAPRQEKEVKKAPPGAEKEAKPAAPRPAKEAQPAMSEPAVLRLPDLNATGCEQLLQQLLEQRKRGATFYRLDFTHVHELEPVALNVLSLFARLPSLDGTAPHGEVVQAAADLRRVLHLTGLDKSWKVLPEQEQ